MTDKPTHRTAHRFFPANPQQPHICGDCTLTRDDPRSAHKPATPKPSLLSLRGLIKGQIPEDISSEEYIEKQREENWPEPEPPAQPRSAPDPLTYVALRSANVERCEQVFHKLHDWSPTDWACAFAGEAGEACNVVKKLRRLDGADATDDTPERRAEIVKAIAEEIADTMIYADLLAARLGIDLGEAVRDKFNEVSRRRGSTVFL